MILALGQVPMGDSTLGGQFVAFSKGLFLRATEKIPKTAKKVSEQAERELSTKEIFSQKKLDELKMLMKREDLTEDDGEAVKSLLNEK